MTAEIERIYEQMGDTWPQILKYNYEKYGDTHLAMRYKHYGIWQPCTWKDYYLNVKYLALGLKSLGFADGDKILIIGDNAPQWYYAELAAQSNHGIAIGIHPDMTPLEIQYVAQNSEAKCAMVQDQEQVDKLLEIKDKLPKIENIIYWRHKGLTNYQDPLLKGYEQILQLGKEYESVHPGLFEQNVTNGDADDICAIVYTSGTTGDTPKGAVHSYRTIKAGADFYLHLDHWYKNDNIFPYVPPVWITEQWFAIGCHLISASILNFAEEPETLQDDIREIGPHMVLYGARVWEAQAGRVQARIREADALKRLFFRLLMPIGYKAAEAKQKKQKQCLLQQLLYAFANITLFRPIRDSLGLINARICYTTGSLLSAEAFKFYHALNLPLKSTYGSAEGGALTGSRNENICLETIGAVNPAAKVKITEAGEIIYQQPGVFLGYHNDPQKTADVLKDGWFHSGDSGFLREDGYLVLLDRLNDVIMLAAGEKFAPQMVESKLRFSPYIKDAWIVGGPGGDFISAVIVIDYESTGRWAGERNITYTTFAELSQKQAVYELIRQDIERVNKDLAQGTRIRKYVNLHKEFDPDESELTRNRKLRKSLLQQRYRELIDAIYSNMTEISMEAQIRYRDGRMGTLKTTLSIQAVEGASQ